jgi:hypothetical protein
MPSAKTETTELSVGFGLLGFTDPIQAGIDIQRVFDNTLPLGTYLLYITEYQSNHPLYSQFIEIGNKLRTKVFLGNVSIVLWTGIQQQAATVMASKDLLIPSANTPISVKNDSHVVANPSPHNLFISVPSGGAVASQAEDWFIEKNQVGLQALYSIARELYNSQTLIQANPEEQLPGTVIEFYQQVNRDGRKKLQAFLKNGMNEEQVRQFNRLYVSMCTEVSSASANEFNHQLNSLRPNLRAAVYEGIIRQFFRINAVDYILCGLDNGHPFAVHIPELTSWKHDWVVQSIIASGVPERGQSVVNIVVDIQNKHTKIRYSLAFHVEVRWSHGKLCGNPEAKLYKEFDWTDVPFYEVIDLH